MERLPEITRGHSWSLVCTFRQDLIYVNGYSRVNRSVPKNVDQLIS